LEGNTKEYRGEKHSMQKHCKLWKTFQAGKYPVRAEGMCPLHPTAIEILTCKVMVLGSGAF
jgi:hypothetical protein